MGISAVSASRREANRLTRRSESAGGRGEGHIRPPIGGSGRWSCMN